MPKAKLLLFSFLCLLFLSSIASISTVKSQLSCSNLTKNANGNIEPSGIEPFEGAVYLSGNVFNVTFVESGLPPGTQWEVILNGTQHSSATKTIKFGNVSAATYLWSIPNATATYSYEGNGPVYLASPSSGGMNICPYFFNTEQQIAFYPVSTTSSSPSSASASSAEVPEFSWLVIMPLLLSVLSVAVIVRHRKTANLNK
jgi:hypothetical protein